MQTMNQPQLTKLEWQAVSVALNDAARCGCPPPDRPSLLHRIYAALTGNRRIMPLANPRLEAVRRFVCDTRRNRRPAETVVPELLAQGFSTRQIDALALLSA